MSLKSIALAGVAALALSAAALPGTAIAQTAQTTAAPAAKFAPWGVDLNALDAGVKPGDDFWAYVNGGWDKRTEINSQRTFAGIDSVLNDQIDEDVRSIIEDMAKDPTAHGPLGQQIGDFYASWMDEAAIESRGTAPLNPYLDRIDGAKSRGDLVDLFASTGFASPIGVGIAADLKDPTLYTVNIDQSGLGLPTRDYYLLPDPKFKAYRTAYRAYIAKMLAMAGYRDSDPRADRILALETALAKVHWPLERLRDVDQTYHPMSRAKLRGFAPQFQWDQMLTKLGLESAPQVVVGEPSAIAASGKLFASTPMSTWQDYLAFHFVSDHAQFLPKAFDDAAFDFYSKTLRGVPVKRDRWKRGVDMVNGSLGEAVGQIYVQRRYPPESDRQMGELIANIRTALAQKIANASWMDPATREAAKAKLDEFDPRIGHPATYIDYSTLKVAGGDLFGNALRSEQFDWDLMLARYPKPVDRSLWDMLPQTNNAYYNPSTNQITFPAAILQPPYFDPNADPAANYGSIGATIGHEIGHGFDDQGRKFDGAGRLRDWWTKGTAAKYDAHAQALVKQFDQFEPIAGLHIKGQQTLGENLGDLGGLEVAYAAYRRYVAEHGEPPVVGGLTGDQRFFIAYGYSWETKYREDTARSRLLADVHSPAKYRVNGIVRNMDEWYKAFNVQPGDKLYLPPDQRVHVW
ncbi:MAG: M13 family metallopeptidase [Sphingomicrobium sp.]